MYTFKLHYSLAFKECDKLDHESRANLHWGERICTVALSAKSLSDSNISTTSKPFFKRLKLGDKMESFDFFFAARGGNSGLCPLKAS